MRNKGEALKSNRNPPIMNVFEREKEFAVEYRPSAAPLHLLNFFINTRHLHPGAIVVDIGGGQSGFSATLSNNGFHTLAIDALYNDLSLMDRRFFEGIEILKDPKHGIPIDEYALANIFASRAVFDEDWAKNHSHYIPGMMGRLPIRSKSVDLAYSVFSLPVGNELDEEMFSLQIEEGVRILRSGGQFQFVPYEHNNSPLGNMHAKMRRKFDIHPQQLYDELYRGVIFKD
jgi:hypothetical protein